MICIGLINDDMMTNNSTGKV